ncbi:asparagine synthase (glutamine-hydrolyzing) (plasmid) [Azospirillum humicireducens]|uniref:asparagine synthase (glutamine-hydrolyzing) n=1 Tax=Azospirillum humicireducens TaxID=1226968 RepID=A0A2R4VUG4_9PROT|nr:asparagine synthase (glutamine-hydrolyzing) [Azospirillum humicireducens]AWB08075.1 asparagine synthase (glutamine-hydrolyzing) [Azospirillum humicireducens]
MCGIAGVISLTAEPLERPASTVAVMNRLLAHRGPDGHGLWVAPDRRVALGHQRLSIIDLSSAGAQPMHGPGGLTLTYNGEIFNYMDLRRRFEAGYPFRTRTDSECILAAYAALGPDCLDELRGMFAFALWDDARQQLFCARDRFGVKPFFYAQVDGRFYFASEIKALLPFLPAAEQDPAALAEYLTFQYTLGEETLFRGVRQLLPGQALRVDRNGVHMWRYWDVQHEMDLDHSAHYFVNRTQELVEEAVSLTMVSDVPVGTYLSGGFDSSLVTLLAAERQQMPGPAFHGKFSVPPGFDESHYARVVAEQSGSPLYEVDITPSDFLTHIEQVIYHLDVPIAGPGSFPQYMVSRLAARHTKVVLGGQGGDEIFGGYARYLLAYFEQCIKAAVNGTYQNGNFVVTIESIVPNLGALQEYVPLMQEFWRKGLFGSLDDRYFQLIDRSADMEAEVDWTQLDKTAVVDKFKAIFNNRNNVRKEAYFDSMTHFDLKCLLPALLHVEDRMSMAHGLESRVPLLDHKLVEFAATIPANIKFKNGKLKHLLRKAFKGSVPRELYSRRDKMGFPVPLKPWLDIELKDFVHDLFGSQQARQRGFINTDVVLGNLAHSGRFSRKLWGLMSLELWHRRFIDQAAEFRRMPAAEPEMALSPIGEAVA